MPPVGGESGRSGAVSLNTQKMRYTDCERGMLKNIAMTTEVTVRDGEEDMMDLEEPRQCSREVGRERGGDRERQDAITSVEKPAPGSEEISRRSCGPLRNKGRSHMFTLK